MNYYVPYESTTWPVGEPYVRQAILDHISSTLPRVHTEMQAQLGIDDQDFPIFTRIDRDGPPRAGLGWDEYALLSLAVLTASNMQTTDYDDRGEPEQLVQYRVRLYSFVKANQTKDEDPNGDYGFPRVVRLRGWMEAAVRNVLTSTPGMGTTHGSVIPSSITAQFSDIQSVSAGTWVAAVYHEFTFQNQETTVGIKVATVDTTHVDTDLMDN